MVVWCYETSSERERIRLKLGVRKANANTHVLVHTEANMSSNTVSCTKQSHSLLVPLLLQKLKLNITECHIKHRINTPFKAYPKQYTGIQKGGDIAVS